MLVIWWMLRLFQMFITPLQEADPSVIPRDRLPQFVQDVFGNIREITVYHQQLIEQLSNIQREYHPRIPSITAAVFDAALNFREAYLEYIPRYPVAAYRIEDELGKNPNFKFFHDVSGTVWRNNSFCLCCHIECDTTF